MIGFRRLSMVLGLAFGTTFAVAQQARQDPDRDVVYEMARNKVGLLRYCKQQGFLDAGFADEAIEGAQGGVSAVTAFRETPVSERDGERAEKNGEAGLWGASRSPMEQMAHAFVKSPAALCKDWADESAAGRVRSAPANQP
jgi:hypothetical protein